MQLNRFTDYSLRVLIYLAGKNQELATIGEIANHFSLSEGHLMKVVHHLAKCGHIVTLRGKGGGMRLARAAAEINLGVVVRDTEERFDLVECLKEQYHGECKLFGTCQLMGVLSEANRLFLQHLDRYTLADLTTGHAPPSMALLQKANPMAKLSETDHH